MKFSMDIEIILLLHGYSIIAITKYNIYNNAWKCDNKNVILKLDKLFNNMIYAIKMHIRLKNFTIE